MKSNKAEEANSGILNFVVPSDLAQKGNIKSCISSLYEICWWNIEEQQNGNNVIYKIPLKDDYKDITLSDYLAKISNYWNITAEEFKFLSQYAVNIDAVKSNMGLVSDPELFNEMLKHINDSEFLKEKIYFSVKNIYPESVKKLLKYGFSPCSMFSKIVDNSENTDKDLQSKNLTIVIESENFSWHDANYYNIDLALFEKLVTEHNMPATIALDNIFRFRSIDGNLPKNEDEKKKIEELVVLICSKIKENGDSLATSYVNIQGFSPEMLQALLDTNLAPDSIFKELWRQMQVSDNPITEDYINFLKNNKQHIVPLLKNLMHSPNVLSVEKILKLHSNQLISSEDLLDVIYNYTCAYYDYEKKEVCYRSIDESLLEKVIGIVEEEVPDFRDELAEKFEFIAIHRVDGITFKMLPSKEVVELLYKNGVVDANKLLIYSANTDDMELAKKALTDGADPLYEVDGDRALGDILGEASYEFINHIIDKYQIKKLLPEEILAIANRFSFQERSQLFKKLCTEKDIEQIELYLRGDGQSFSTIKFVDSLLKLLFNLDKEYDQLSNSEKLILSNKQSVSLSDLNKNDELKNSQNFSLLYLAMIARRFDLASEIIQENPKQINDIGKDGINIFSIYKIFADTWSVSDSEIGFINSIGEIILENVENVDIDLGRGETIADILLAFEGAMPNVLGLTKDQLFNFFKSDDLQKTIEQFSKDGMVHIAVAYCYESLWSTGALSVTRLIKQSHDNIVFHLITPEHMKEGGEELLKLFDGFILPGGDDNYPEKPEFDLKDFTEENILPINKQYFTIMEKASEFGAPLFGMCAGAQNHVLQQKGTLCSLKGYSYGRHEIKFQPGTFPYFMSLDKDLQDKIINGNENIILPTVSYKSDTAHNFAGIKGKLGDTVRLSAVSEDDVPMIFRSGLEIFSQFHPEHYYGVKDFESETMYQTNILDSFIRLVKMHHEGNDAAENYVENAMNCMQKYISINDFLDDHQQVVGDVEGL